MDVFRDEFSAPFVQFCQGAANVEEAWLSLMADRHSNHDVDQGSLSAPRFQMYLELLAGVDFCHLASVNVVCDGLHCLQEWNLATLLV